MENHVDPYLTQADLLVLADLLHDVDVATLKKTNLAEKTNPGKGPTLDALAALDDPLDSRFVPTVFLTWDNDKINPLFYKNFVVPYTRIAKTIVRHPTDVVFLNHILLHFTTSVPSVIYLYYNFTWAHGFLHFLFQAWCCGTFTIMMHNHIHNGGILNRKYAIFDFLFPYILEPLFGHTWDSYYYHHVKHHHSEGNGPNDLSSTIRYQRDEPLHFLHYLMRFILLVWIELPIYFVRKNRLTLAVKCLISEVGSYVFIGTLFHTYPRPTTFALILPLILMRIAMMVGNWGQHALVDEADPTSDFRSSITLIDVPSNRFCFNDGYHTSHHLNPLRHWRHHPSAFLKAKKQYAENHALVFRNIDYLMLTFRLLTQNYEAIAKCLVPIGDEQIKMTMDQRVAMLRTKTKKFSEEDIERLFGKKVGAGRKVIEMEIEEEIKSEKVEKK